MWEPNHGPGTTADAGRILRDKYVNFRTDAKLDYIYSQLRSVKQYAFLDITLPPRVDRTPLERRSKLVFVPKTAHKLRSISAEPCSLMWMQQGFKNALYRMFKSHPYLKHRIDLERPVKNGALAYYGSMDGSYATIDLSAASDSVSWDLVNKWFRHTCLLPSLICTRSDRTVFPDGSWMSLDKFAPMGSALCFPIECIVFAACVEASIMDMGEDPNTVKYRVYGDDIIVEERFAQPLIDRLTRNNFKVNTEKSYWSRGNHFRESCGYEYLHGIDVAPTYISRKFSGCVLDRFESSRILALTKLANDCFIGLPSVRRYVIDKLNCLPTRMRPEFFSVSDGRGLISPSPTNWKLAPAQWDAATQQPMTWAGGPKTTYPKSSDTDEDIRLYEYLRLSEGRQRLLFPEDAVSANITQAKTRWNAVRVPSGRAVDLGG